MKKLELSIPEDYSEFTLVAKRKRDYGDGKKAGKKLYDSLHNEIPAGLYLAMEEELIITYLQNTLDIDQLEKIKEVIAKNISFLTTGMDFNRNIQEAIRRIEKQKEETKK
jgi:hypothetical protein